MVQTGSIATTFVSGVGSRRWPGGRAAGVEPGSGGRRLHWLDRLDRSPQRAGLDSSSCSRGAGMLFGSGAGGILLNLKCHDGLRLLVR